VSKYKISGGNQGSVGDNARAKNFTQNAVFMRELTDLTAELTKRARTPEQLEAARQIADAEAAAKTGDSSTVRKKLKAAGAWALGVAKEVGTDVVAKVISQQLGA